MRSQTIKGTNQVKVIFDKHSKNWVLGIFDKTVDNEGFIVEKDGTRIWTPEGNEIKSDELAMIKKGSIKFIAGDLSSLMKESKGEI